MPDNTYVNPFLEGVPREAPTPPDAGAVPDTTAPYKNPFLEGVPTERTPELTGMPDDLALKESIRLGEKLDPVLQARVLKVDKATRNTLPLKFIEENIDDLERASALKSFDPMHFRATSPKLAQWLQGDQRLAALTRKDRDKLSFVEQVTTGTKIKWEMADARVLELASKELNKQYMSGAEQAEFKMLKERNAKLAGYMQDAPLTMAFPGAGAYSVRQAGQSWEAMGKGAALGAITSLATGNLATVAPMTLVGALGGGALLSYQHESASAWMEYSEARDMTGALIDQDVARKAAHFYGVASSLIETGLDVALGFGLRKLLPGVREATDALGITAAKKFLRAQTMELLKNPTRSRAIFGAIGAVGGGATMEGFEEFLQQMIQTAIGGKMKDSTGKPFDPTDWAESKAQGMEAAREAFMGSMFLLGPASGVSTMRTFGKIAQAEENQKLLQVVVDAAKDSDTLKNAPEVYQDAARVILAGGPIENMYVPVTVWDRLFQADARAAAQEILGDSKQYDEAKGLTGADIVIPPEVYAAKVAGTPLHEQLAQDIRLQQGGMSAREAAEARGKTNQILAAMESEAGQVAEREAPIKQIEQEMLDMVSPFMSGIEAQRVAILQGQRYATRAARLGVDPLELWKREAPIIQRDFLGSLSPEALASRENFAEMNSGNMLTSTGKVWEKPGDELTFYTGSGADITTFRPKQAGAVFLSPSPSTASEFAYRGTPERDTAGAVYKVHAVAYRPFDYDNEAHVADIEQALAGVTDRDVAMQSASQSLRGFYTNKQQLIDFIRKGAWGAIEHPLVQKAIRSKHDAFWVMEEGVKNIGIYDPKKIKSAIGNRGTYDLTKDNILYQTLPSSVATNVGAALDVNAIRLADLPLAQQDPELLAKLAAAINEEIGMRISGDPVEVLEAAIQRMTDNLLWLHDQVPDPVRQRSRLWYDGAQGFASRWAQRWNKTLAQTAGMLATLSPQKDWFMNATMGERVGDILDTQMDFAWSDRMNAAAFKFLAADLAKPGDTANKTAFALIQGKTLRDVVAAKNARAIGMWIRAYDEAYNSSAHAIISPEGQFQGNVMSAQAKEARRAWGDFTAIGKAASIFLDGSPRNISKQIGTAHKVRNFYNNIFNASDPRFTTIDTHAVAAAHLRPFAGSDRAVAKNFGAAGKSSVLGIYGSYPIYYEAYRRAAEARGLLPRELQSITWEAVRAMFPDTFKTEKNKRAVDRIWADVDAGKIGAARARTAVKRLVLGESELPAPSWFAGRVESHLLRDSTYTKDREPHHGIQINFEVAPDPRNEDLTSRWKALPLEIQQRVSTDIAWNAVAKALAAFGDANMKGELHTQLGGWAGLTNPSFGLWLDANVSRAKGLQLARLLGYALRQESMSVVSSDRFAGGEELGAVMIQGVDDLMAHGVYQDLQAAFGADTIGGHTTSNGDMIILVGNPALAETLATQIAGHLGEAYTVGSGSAYGTMFEEKDDYGLHRESFTKGVHAGSSLREVGDQLRREAAEQVEAFLRQGDPDSPGSAVSEVPGPLRQEDPVSGHQFSRDGSRRGPSGSLAPLEGAPVIQGATGPDPALVAVAERYAADAGIPLARQSEYVRVDEGRARRIAAAYEAMAHAPQDPKVKEAYADLLRQTRAQYDALVAAGYEFTFFDDVTDPYQGNPWNAMRDLRANRRMAVYGTYAGFGTEGLTAGAVDDNPLLADTGLEWPDQDGVMHVVTGNDLFRAVHDAFGHGLEGAGFRAQGEENAWQAHARLFTGPALGALTSETRGQNSWLNFGPYGEQNQTAKVENTVFAEQKTGLMPEWTWTEGRVGDMPTATLATDTLAFKRWFGDSKVVDAQGKPLVVYHGTASDFQSFSKKRLGYVTETSDAKLGFWFTDHSPRADMAAEDAQAMTEDDAGANVMPVFLKMENPYESWETLGDPAESAAVIRKAKRAGYDGVIFMAGELGGTNYVAFRPEQIKSAIGNRGTFDPNDANILNQRTGESVVRGQFETAAAGERPIVTLFKAANPSTIYHELSHSWLEELRRDAESDIATPQLKADWETIKRLSGMADLKPGAKIPRASHEWFARNSEAYVRDGKAPSLELRNVFQQFGAWLKQIYRSIKQLISEDEINPEFRKVMDRLLATDEQIALAQEEANQTAMTFSDLTEAENAAYNKQVNEVRQEAEERVRAEAMAELVRERKAWWRAEKAQVTREVEEEVNTRPEYQVASWLRTGRLLDGSAPEGLEHQRLDRQAIVYQYGEEMANKLAFMVQATGGLHPDVVAEAFDGFETGDQMLKAITEAPPRREVIKAEVDRIMKERHGDMLEDGRLPERAIAAVHGDKQADVLLTELRIMRRLGAKGELTTWQELQKLATEIAGRMVVSDLDPKHYVAAGAKMAREAEQAMIKKDYDSAFNAKMRQAINLAMVQEVIKRKTLVDKSLQSWKLLDQINDKLAKRYDMNLVNTARAVLGDYGIGRQGEKAMTYLNLVAEYDPKTYADMAEVIQLATQNAKHYQDLTADEFTQMKEIVDGTIALARSTQKSLVDGQRVDRKELLDQLIAAIDALGNPKDNRGRTAARGLTDTFSVKMLGTKALLTRIEHLMERLDGFKPDGAFTKIVWRPVSEGATLARERRVQVMTKFLELTKLLEGRITNDTITATELASDTNPDGYVFGKLPETVKEKMFESIRPFLPPGVNTKSGKVELIGALLHTGNREGLDSNMAKLLLGGRGPEHTWGSLREDGTLDTSKWDAFIQRMIDDGILGKAEFDFVQGVWDLMEELKPEVQKAHKEMYGYFFNGITATPFTVTVPTGFTEVNGVRTPTGFRQVTYRGGYMPAITDPSLSGDAARRAAEAAIDPVKASFAWPTTGRGATMSRSAKYWQPLQLNLGLVQQHIDWAIRFAYIEPRVREVSRLIMTKEFRDKVSDFVDPTILNTAIIPWLNRTATQQVEHANPDSGWSMFDGLAHEMRTRTSAQIMVLNVSNTLQQATGLSSALLYVEPRHMKNALVAYMFGPRELTAEVNRLSTFMRTRTTASIVEVNQAIKDILLDPTKYDKARAFASRHGYILQQGAQNIVDIITWHGAYNQAIVAKVSEKEAIARADAAVRKTQGSFNAEDLSKIEVGTAGHRFFLMFYSYFNLQANLLGTKFAEAFKIKSPARLFYVYVFGYMITATLADGIAQAMSGDLFDDDDDDGYLDNFMSIFFTGQFRFGTAMVPYVGPVANVAVSKFNDKWYDDKISASATYNMMESAAGAPSSVYKALVDDGSHKRAIKDTLSLIGLLTGLPTGAIARPLGYLADVEQGRVEPSGSIDYARGLVTGR